MLPVTTLSGFAYKKKTKRGAAPLGIPFAHPFWTMCEMFYSRSLQVRSPVPVN